MVVFRDIRRLLARSALLAQAKDGQEAMECRPGAAVEADEKQEYDPEDNADDDACDGAAAETASRVGFNERSVCAGRDGCREGKCGRR